MRYLRRNIKRWLETDFMLRDKINSLTNNPRYSEIVKKYYRKMKDDGQNAIANRYENVLTSLTGLWIDSEKNPSLFKDTKDFEPILQRNPLYRDHFVHSFNVFLLGYYIINKLNECTRQDYFGANKRAVNLTWMLASTFHDVAYPIQQIESWLNDFLKKFLGVNPMFSLKITDVLPMIYTNFMQMLSIYHLNPHQKGIGPISLDSMDWAYYNEVGSKLIEKEHGVLGALMLCHQMAIREGFLDEGGRIPNERTKWDFFFDHLPACHAISLHHLRFAPVKFTRHPFAFLLMLCDEIQDWGRPSLHGRKDVVTLKDIEILNTTPPTIEFKLEASEERRMKLDKLLAEYLHAGERLKISIKRASTR